MIAKETLSLLRSEIDAKPGSFLLKLRTDLEWDHVAFSRLVRAMHEYVAMAEHGGTIERWIAEGFWYLGHFVRDWSQHPNFPRPLPSEYYESAYERFHDLAYWLFHGESPYESGSGFEDLGP